MSRLAIGLALLLLASGARADVLVVPDDFPTIQAAVNFAGEGDEIVVKAGVYAEAVLIQSKVGLVLRGQGKAVVRPGSGEKGIVAQQCTDIVVRDLFVDRAQVGIEANNCLGAQVLHCTVTRAEFNGIVVLNHAGAAVVDGCSVKDGVRRGLFLNANDPASAVVTNNVVDGLGDALEVDGFPLAEVRGNSLRSVDLGLNQNIGAGLIVDDCVAAAPGDVVIADNQVRGGRGLQLTSCVGITVSGNQVRDCIAEGIDVEDSDGVALAGNTILDVRGNGIEVDFASSDVLVGSNVVRKARDIGIRLRGPGATCTGNTVSKSGFDGLSIEGDDGLVSDNLVTGAGRVGLVLGSSSSGNTLSANVVKGSGAADLFDQSSGDNIIGGNNEFGTTAP